MIASFAFVVRPSQAKIVWALKTDLDEDAWPGRNPSFEPRPCATFLSAKLGSRISARLLGPRQRGVRRVRIISLHPLAFVPANNLVFFPSDMANANRGGGGEFYFPN